MVVAVPSGGGGLEPFAFPPDVAAKCVRLSLAAKVHNYLFFLFMLPCKRSLISSNKGKCLETDTIFLSGC